MHRFEAQDLRFSFTLFRYYHVKDRIGENSLERITGGILIFIPGRISKSEIRPLVFPGGRKYFLN